MKTLTLIAALFFTASCGSPEPDTKPSHPASDAVKALRKLEAASQVAASREQFGALVIDAKAAVNTANRSLPDGELKRELNAAVLAYADALEIWGGPAPGGDYVHLRIRLGEEYGVDVMDTPSDMLVVRDPDALRKVLAKARERTARAADLVDK